MILLGKIDAGGIPVVVGSVHKLDGHRKDITNYIGSTQTVIAGDQASSFCSDVSLKTIKGSSGNHNTWKATCTSYGYQRGDNICSNMKVVEDEFTKLPCVTKFSTPMELSDHALTFTTLELESGS